MRRSDIASYIFIAIVLTVTLTFSIFKSVGIIDWNWIWVISPMWIATCLIVNLVVNGWLLMFLLKE